MAYVMVNKQHTNIHTKRKDAKSFKKSCKPCHIIYWIALAEYFQMGTHALAIVLVVFCIIL